MCIVFVEYAVLMNERSGYLQWAEELRRSHGGVDLYESKEQPGLFVEIWNDLSDEAYQAMKSARQGEPLHSPDFAFWNQLDPWLSGGRAKIHIWRFEKVK